MNFPAQFTKPLIENITKLTKIQTVEFKELKSPENNQSTPAN